MLTIGLQARRFACGLLYKHKQYLCLSLIRLPVDAPFWYLSSLFEGGDAVIRRPDPLIKFFERYGKAKEMLRFNVLLLVRLPLLK